MTTLTLSQVIILPGKLGVKIQRNGLLEWNGMKKAGSGIDLQLPGAQSDLESHGYSIVKPSRCKHCPSQN